MSQKFTAEEVRALAGDYLDASIVAEMLHAYADLLERIKADESAVPVAQLRLRLDRWDVVGIHGEIEKLHLPSGEYPLFTRPPAQAVPVAEVYEYPRELQTWNSPMLRAVRFLGASPLPIGTKLFTHPLAQAAQAGVTDEVVERATVAYARTASKHIPVSAVSMRAALLAVWPNPPAQAAQVDSANWFAGKYPTTTEPVAQGEVRLWDTQWVNIVNHDNCYRDWDKSDAINHAVKMTEQAIARNVTDGKLPPPRIAAAPSVSAEPAQPADSGREDLWVVFDEVASWLPYDGDGNRIRERFSEACATLAAQGQGEPVAWLAADGSGRVIDVKAKSAGARASATASATSVYSIPLYAAPPAPEGDA